MQVDLKMDCEWIQSEMDFIGSLKAKNVGFW